MIGCAFPLRLNDEVKEVCRPILIQVYAKRDEEMYGTFPPSPKGWKQIPIEGSRTRGWKWREGSSQHYQCDLYFLWNMTNEIIRKDPPDDNIPIVLWHTLIYLAIKIVAYEAVAVEPDIAGYVWGNIVVIILCLEAVVWVPLSILVNSYVSACMFDVQK
ncbi:unnamed protein product [Dibothriocephalus latus]|uniref:Uncharacterized protein n=1 Tax=Dibothriocephalus latus TaxID=60516 RepID=A0A3P7PAP3_DIBLA|nr:unnamed protein product [Dibothriocephalus latus]